jgi:Uma2 family endonuclease
MTSPAQTLVSLEDYLAMPDYPRYEWVDGCLVERHMSAFTSWIAAKVANAISNFVLARGLGYVTLPDNGLVLDPERPRAYRFADVAFTSRVREPDGPPVRGHQTVAPELAVEVVSPGDDAGELNRKVAEYLAGGVQLIWVVYPETRTVDVLRVSGNNSRLTDADTLSGEDVLPGFELPIAAIFDDPNVPR